MALSGRKKQVKDFTETAALLYLSQSVSLKQV